MAEYFDNSSNHIHLNQMSVEGVPSEDLVLAVRPLVLHLPLVLFLLLTLLHHLQQNNGSMCHELWFSSLFKINITVVTITMDRETKREKEDLDNG